MLHGVHFWGGNLERDPVELGRKGWSANTGQEGVTWLALSLTGWSLKLAPLHSLGLTNAFLHSVSPLTQGCLARGAQLALFYHALTDVIQTVSSNCEQAACWPSATVMRPLAKYPESRQRWRLAGVIQINTQTFWGSVFSLSFPIYLLSWNNYDPISPSIYMEGGLLFLFASLSTILIPRLAFNNSFWKPV